jgi:hypothetical protein
VRIGDDTGAAAPCAKGITAPHFPIHIAHARDCKAVLPVGYGIIFAVESKRFLLRAVGNGGRCERYCGGWRANRNSFGAILFVAWNFY